MAAISIIAPAGTVKASLISGTWLVLLANITPSMMYSLFAANESTSSESSSVVASEETVCVADFRMPFTAQSVQLCTITSLGSLVVPVWSAMYATNALFTVGAEFNRSLCERTPINPTREDHPEMYVLPFASRPKLLYVPSVFAQLDSAKLE